MTRTTKAPPRSTTSAYVGRPLTSIEDERLVRGQGQYIDDIRIDNIAEAAVLRSPFAAALVQYVDTGPANQLPGVVGTWTAADLGELNGPFSAMNAHPGLTALVNHGALAGERVHYVGEPVAFVVANDRYIAEDALEQIDIEYDPLDPVVDMVAAVEPSARLIHAGAPGNICGSYNQGTGHADSALANAPHVFRHQLRIDRGAAQPMETRAVLAEYSGGHLTVWSNTQLPHRLRDFLANRLEIPIDRTRLIAPDVGGSFGCKADFYPEDLLVCLAAIRLGRPVRWVEDRYEHFLSTMAERGQVFEVEVGVDHDGRLMALKVDFLHDLGAYAPYGFATPQNTANHMLGPYRIPHVQISWRGVYTNLTPSATYRGAGRPQGVFVIERTLDLVARSLGIDPVELRRRNMIEPWDLPYDTGMDSGIGRIVYDTGSHREAMEAAVRMVDYDSRRAAPKPVAGESRVGVGIANYVEMSVVTPFEGARVRLLEDGSVVASTGTASQGQSHETTLAQVCADALGVSMERISVRTGDTAEIERGAGTYGSRVAIMSGSAVHAAAAQLRARVLDRASILLGAAVSELDWQDGAVAISDEPARRVDLATVAMAERDAGSSFDEVAYFETNGMLVANGTHAVELEVDPDSGVVTILRYVVAHDCGKVLNPLVVEGQIYGGVVQGIGGSLYEQLIYDDDGQPLTASFMDYLLPMASLVPPIELVPFESPSPHNPIGVKGVGEGGILPTYAAIAAALESAIGVPIESLPLSPAQIRDLMKSRS